MDAKVTLSFNQEVINKAKRFADANNISLSRMIEYLLQKVTSSNYNSLEDFPISDWVHQIAEGEAVYQTKQKTRKSTKAEFYKSKR